MAIKENRREQEVEEADQAADGACCRVNVDVLARSPKAELITELRIAVEALLCVLVNGEDIGAYMNDDLDPNGKEEHHEGVVVLDTDAIVNPWAVVVESLDALVANGAVP